MSFEPTLWSKVGSIKGELERAGKKVIGLHEGDIPVFGHTNQPLSEYLVQAAREGWHMYPPVTTWPGQLKKAISEFEKFYRYVDYSPDDIILTPGGAGCYQLLHFTLLDPGDELAAIEPAHYLAGPTSYMYCYKSKVVTSSCDEANDWEPNLDELRDILGDKTKGIVLDHPNNPTGAVYSDKAVKGIVDLAGEFDIPVISDELYGLITFDGVVAKSMASIAGDVPVIVMNSMSKIFMRPGWRVGYMAFHDPEGKIEDVSRVAKKVARLYGQATTCIPTPLLVAATRSFRSLVDRLQGEFSEVGSAETTETTGALREMIDKLQNRRDFTYKRLNEIDGTNCTKPRASLYALPRVDAIGKTWKTDDDFILDLLKEEHIIFAPGHHYGKTGAGHFRTILTPNLEILEDIYGRLERFLSRHTA